MGSASDKTSFNESRIPPKTILEKLKKSMKSRGIHGIRGFGRIFRRMDVEGNRKLDRQEFTWGLKENGHYLTRNEYEALFK